MVERKRHLAKAVTYRLFGSAGTAAIAYIATGDAGISASIGALDTFAKIGLYYFHERLWYRVRWGVRVMGSEAHGVRVEAKPVRTDRPHPVQSTAPDIARNA